MGPLSLGDLRSRPEANKNQQMTTVGIVGGLGPESTIDYYRRILEAWERNDSSTAPSIVIDSLDVRRALHLVATDRAALTEYLLSSLRRLVRRRGGLRRDDGEYAPHRVR